LRYSWILNIGTDKKLLWKCIQVHKFLSVLLKLGWGCRC